jgi:hypothetical protein
MKYLVLSFSTIGAMVGANDGEWGWHVFYLKGLLKDDG